MSVCLSVFLLASITTCLGCCSISLIYTVLKSSIVLCCSINKLAYLLTLLDLCDKFCYVCFDAVDWAAGR